MTTSDIQTLLRKIEALEKAKPSRGSSGTDMWNWRCACIDALFDPNLRAALLELDVMRRGVGEEVRKELQQLLYRRERSVRGADWETVAQAGWDFLQNHAPSILASASLAERVEAAEGLLRRAQPFQNGQLRRDIDAFLAPPAERVKVAEGLLARIRDRYGAGLATDLKGEINALLPPPAPRDEGKGE